MDNLSRIYNLFNLLDYNLNFLKIDKQIYFFKDVIIDNTLNLIFFNKFLNNNNDFIKKTLIKIFKKNTIKNMSLYLFIREFMNYKLLFINNTNTDLLITIFFERYIFFDINVINNFKKYNLTINSFKNFNKLYIFLKDTGMVDLYYNTYAPYMINYYMIIYDELCNHPKLDNFKKRYLKKIQKCKDINSKDLIINMINSNIKNDLIKNNINNKFINYVEKYNIK
jgi:hypothetical protein